MKKPNILFLFADDMRYDTIAEIGDPQVITPNLDELARSGTAFVNACPAVQCLIPDAIYFICRKAERVFRKTMP